jgi:hypothetical protein
MNVLQIMGDAILGCRTRCFLTFKASIVARESFYCNDVCNINMISHCQSCQTWFSMAVWRLQRIYRKFGSAGFTDWVWFRADRGWKFGEKGINVRLRMFSLSALPSASISLVSAARRGTYLSILANSGVTVFKRIVAVNTVACSRP